MCPQIRKGRRWNNECGTCSTLDRGSHGHKPGLGRGGQDEAAEARAWTKRLIFSTGNPFHQKRNPRKETIMSNAGVAAILSFVLPGCGQLYNGDFCRGAFWLLVTPGLWFSSAGIVGGACHLVSAYTAYHRTKLKEQADSRSKEESGESVTIECTSPCPAR